MQVEFRNTGLVRPDHQSVKVGHTGAGIIVVDVERGSQCVRIVLTPAEAETFGVGVLGAVGLERAANAPNVVDPRDNAQIPLQRLGG